MKESRKCFSMKIRYKCVLLFFMKKIVYNKDVSKNRSIRRQRCHFLNI